MLACLFLLVFALCVCFLWLLLFVGGDCFYWFVGLFAFMLLSAAFVATGSALRLGSARLIGY